jgi:pyruvate dehydrogenase E2 component (dihydrolipoamide acetyltransferase)
MADIRPFCMPKWGIEMTEGTIAEWMVKEGDAFKKGQTLCLIETAKITNEVEAEFDAVLKRLLVPAGEEAQPVGALLAVFGDAGATDAEVDSFIANFKPAGGAPAPQVKPAAAAAPAAPQKPAPAKAAIKIETNRPISPQALKLAQEEQVDLSRIEGTGRGGRITHQDVHQALRGPATPSLRGPSTLPAEDLKVFASPLARRTAELLGVDLSTITGTGVRGRISKADVLKAAPSTAPASTPAVLSSAQQVEIVPFDRIRKVVASRLSAAKRDIPHFYLKISVAMDQLLLMRKHANLALGAKASINDYIVNARALVRHPDINVQVHGDALHRFSNADIAIAVASPKGLVTPIVRGANLMRIDQIANETRRLIDRAQAGRLSYEDMDGGTFSVSNLGMMGVEDFAAIINPPQAAILAVGGVVRTPVEKDGGVAFESRTTLTLSVDHRAIDGAAGAAFLATLKGLIEDPSGLFA